MGRNVLNTSHAETIADAVLDTLESDGGYSVDEIIPGLIQGVIDIAQGDDSLLDAAANLLADGGVRPEEYVTEEEDDA